MRGVYQLGWMSHLSRVYCWRIERLPTFRMYARLTANAREMLDRSREFKRGIDNTVYHKGYPINYREQRGTPSIQVSIALDGRLADVDVDYRSSSFPVMLFNGHLSASNSDVRAGDNAERHAARWSGLRTGGGASSVCASSVPLTRWIRSPRLLCRRSRAPGKKNIDVMVPDFLQAWLVEGDVVAAMGYVSERSYACLAQDTPDPSAFDRGLAPFQILVNLKAAHDALGKHDSLEGLTIGVPLTIPGLRAVRQPRHAQFALYDVPDDLAARFDCASRLTPGAPTQRIARVRPALWCELPHRRAAEGRARSRCCGPERTGTGRSCPGRRPDAR